MIFILQWCCHVLSCHIAQCVLHVDSLYVDFLFFPCFLCFILALNNLYYSLNLDSSLGTLFFFNFMSKYVVIIEIFGSFLLVLSISFILYLISHCCFKTLLLTIRVECKIVDFHDNLLIITSILSKIN
jgi:hypothetical protein